MKSWPQPQIPAIPGSGRGVRLYDTATKELVPAARTAGSASMHVCGITPYDATHLGHAATYLAYDVLVRAWLDEGRKVTYLQNVTDVDDPLLERAAATGVDWRHLAQDQTALFREDMTVLGVVPPTSFAAVTDAIDSIADLAARLLKVGGAYRLTGPDGVDDVYADLSQDPLVGSISHLDQATMVQLAAERGGDPDREGKRNPLDPLLWRGARPGEPSWCGGDLGMGRPGWHIECCAMALETLARPFDVQGGGSDLIFPHHECSASHARVATGQSQYAEAYVHCGMVGYQGEKMSKSKGNLVLVSGLRAEGVPAMAIRLALLDQHYRADNEWTQERLDAACARLDLWVRAFSRQDGPPAEPVIEAIREAVSRDLDTPAALVAVDAWCMRQLAEGGTVEAAPGLVSRAANALLGVRV